MSFDLLWNYARKRERQIHASLETDLRFRGGLVLSYRCFVLGVGFYVVLFGGGFVLSYRWFALGFGLGRSGFVLSFRRYALGVGFFGRYPNERP